MNIPPNSSSSNAQLNDNEQRTFESLIPRLRIALFLGVCIFGGGALFSTLNIFGIISCRGLRPGDGTASVLDWSMIGVSGVIGLAFLAAMVFVRPLALRVILRAKTSPAQIATRTWSNYR